MTTSTHAPRVLIVDDEESVCTFAERTLRDNGYDIVTASDGPEALRLIETLANSSAETKPPENLPAMLAGLPPKQVAALTELCLAIFNLNDFLLDDGLFTLISANLGPETLDFVVDRSTVKQGLFTPGTRLKIHSPDKLLEDMPDYTLLLTWNFADEILKQQAEYQKRGGKFILPVPLPRVA